MHETYSLHKDAGSANEQTSFEDFIKIGNADRTKLLFKLLMPFFLFFLFFVSFYLFQFLQMQHKKGNN